jgi:hypothetical protein
MEHSVLEILAMSSLFWLTFVAIEFGPSVLRYIENRRLDIEQYGSAK